MEDDNPLTRTPTWAVALVCVIFVVLSLLMQRGLQVLGKFLLRNKQKPLYEALQKMKEELMLLGFVSLLLTVARNPISKICMPESWADHMLPCGLEAEDGSVAFSPAAGTLDSNGMLRNRRLLWTERSGCFQAPLSALHVAGSLGRSLTEDVSKRQHCKQGHRPVFSPESLHQVHIFIFVMAVVHVFYSCLAMLLGFTQLRSWRKWEEETREENRALTSQITQSFKLERESSFVTSRTSNPWWTSNCGSWVASFFRQFGRAVTKSDYLCLRMGFINTHNASKKFNFHEYMIRTLEDDFKSVVGISGPLWIFVIIFMVLNVHGWYAYLWISFIPILVNMVIGTKLQHIMTQLAFEAAESHTNVKVPIEPRDELFWFSKPHLLLHLIHFVLFQNAFELAYCLWLLFSFGVHSCLIDNHGFIAIRGIVGFLAQVMCSYSTLPLYALVSQMGSHYKKAIFDEPMKNAIYDWRSKAREKRKMRKKMSNFEEARDNESGGSEVLSTQSSGIELSNEMTLLSVHEHADTSDRCEVDEVLPANSQTRSGSDFTSTRNLNMRNQQIDISGTNILPNTSVQHDAEKFPLADDGSPGQDMGKAKLADHFPNLNPPPTFDRSRSSLEFSTRLSSRAYSEWSPDDENMQTPLNPRKEKKSFGRCASMLSMPRKLSQ